MRPDYLVCSNWEAKVGLAICVTSRLLRVPYVLFAHGTDFIVSTRWTALRGLTVRHAARIICVTEYVRSFVRREGAPPGRLTVMHPGVDFAEIVAYRRRARHKPPAAVEAALPPSAPTLLTVCRLVSHKRVDQLINAMPLIVAAVPAARCVVVGSGPEAQRLQELAAASSAAGSIIFLGPLEGDAKWACFERCAVFAMPSIREGFGIVFLEAGAFGCPSIAPRTEPEAGVVLDGETGLLVDPGDTEALAHAAIRLLSDPDEARRLGDNARRRVEAEFDWRVRAAETVEVMREGCGLPSPLTTTGLSE